MALLPGNESSISAACGGKSLFVRNLGKHKLAAAGQKSG